MHDVLIIGAGPAGLTAASYLGRFLRPALVIDGGDSRARWIPESHNVPGFSQGVGGLELLRQLRLQAEKYGARLRSGRVASLTRGDAGFTLRIGDEILLGRYVLLATGVGDHLPELRGAREALLRGQLRVCPICDGFEAAGKNIAVIGDGAHGEHEAEFLRTYTAEITYIHIGAGQDPERPGRLAAAGIDLVETGLDHLAITGDGLRLRLPGRSDRTFDAYYAALGCTSHNGLATALGAQCDENGALTVDSHQQTSIEGLYAAGDVVRGLNQVVVAAAEAAIAATDIHNRLRRTR